MQNKSKNEEQLLELNIMYVFELTKGGLSTRRATLVHNYVLSFICVYLHVPSLYY